MSKCAMSALGNRDKDKNKKLMVGVKKSPSHPLHGIGFWELETNTGIEQ